MNRSDLISVLKQEINLSRKYAERVVDTFFDSITETLTEGERVEIRGFGSFTVNQQADECDICSEQNYT